MERYLWDIEETEVASNLSFVFLAGAILVMTPFARHGGSAATWLGAALLTPPTPFLDSKHAIERV